MKRAIEPLKEKIASMDKEIQKAKKKGARKSTRTPSKKRRDDSEEAAEALGDLGPRDLLSSSESWDDEEDSQTQSSEDSVNTPRTPSPKK